ncbi:MAG: alanine racemase [Ignavibacteriae bacterium]|nr:MAG: alanine racemase [Ignavibacteriota bacterium]
MNPTYAEINLNNLIYNYQNIRRKTKTKVLAVVKADAYGHGMIECVKALSNLKNKPEYYGVALFEEALQLRKAKVINEPVLIFAPFNKELVKEYIKFKVLPTISNYSQIKFLKKLNLKKKLKIHVNINTGMNRLGLHYNEAEKNIVELSKIKNIEIDGVYTHFATSDERDKTYAELQLKRFKKILSELDRLNISYGIIHSANSGAILDMPETYFDMVRPGISLYGYYPSLETSESIKLKPVMSIYSKISTIGKLKKNESRGYGLIFTAKEKLLYGTLPIGYADGLSRGLSNKIDVIIKNKLYPQIGRISMDRIAVNLKHAKIREGSIVTLLGKSKNCKIDAWVWAAILNTIPYEITCSISKRVPRKYSRRNNL